MKTLTVWYLGLILCFIAQTLRGETNSSETTPQILAPGYYSLEFDAPQPGSYDLPSLGKSAGGQVLDTQGNTLELSELLDEHAVLLAFIYRNCHDVNGCPLTELVLRQVQRRLAKEPEFARHLRILSLSFDPRRDTPTALQSIQKSVAAIEAPEWRYLTTDGNKKT